MEDVLTGDYLKRVQETFHRVEEETREAWLAGLEHPETFKPYGIGPTAHVVYPVIDHDDLFVDLMELPHTISITEQFQGPDMLMIDNVLHVKPGGTGAHTVWHQDAPTWDFDPVLWDEHDRRQWDKMRYPAVPFLKIKIFFFVEDVDEDTGPFSVVPGSHRLEGKPTSCEKLEEMPGHIRLTGKAGSAAIWNGHIWHTAMDNTDDKPRCMLPYNYVHFGMKQHESCIPTGAFRERMTRERGPLCKQLLGIERMSRN